MRHINQGMNERIIEVSNKKNSKIELSQKIYLDHQWK